MACGHVASTSLARCWSKAFRQAAKASSCGLASGTAPAAACEGEGAWCSAAGAGAAGTAEISATASAEGAVGITAGGVAATATSGVGSATLNAAFRCARASNTKPAMQAIPMAAPARGHRRTNRRCDLCTRVGSLNSSTVGCQFERSSPSLKKPASSELKWATRSVVMGRILAVSCSDTRIDGMCG